MPSITVDELVTTLSYDFDRSDLEAYLGGTEQASVKTVAFGNILANAATKLAEVGIAAVKAAADLAVDLVTGFADTGDQVAKTARQIGIATDDLQELTFAAERSGVSGAALEKSLKQLQIGLFDAKTKGTGPFAEGLEGLNVQLSDLDTLSTTEQLGYLADRLNEVTNESERTAIASKLFGARAGVELKSLLNEGSVGIEQLTDRVHELGGVMSGDALMSAEQLTDAFLDFNTLSEGAKNTLAAALAPAITEVTNELTNWIAENDDFIQQDLPDLILDVLDAARDLLPMLVEAARKTSDVVEAVQAFEEKTGTLSRAISVLTWPIDVLNSALSATRDLLVDIVNGILNLAGTIPGLEDKVESFRDSVPFLGPTAAQGVTGKTRRELEQQDEEARQRVAKEREAPKVIGGLAPVGSTAPRRTREEVLQEKIDKKQDLSSQERREASDLGLEPPKRKGGGGRGKPKASPGDFLSELIGDKSGKVQAGGGTTPLSGAKFVEIDASFHFSAPVSIDATRSGADAQEIADTVETTVERKLREAARRRHDHFKNRAVEIG